MRIGVMSGATSGPDGTLDGLVARAKDLEARGFHSVWMANIFGIDAITAQAVVGRETERIELGTAVVPTYPRHPVAIAQQALTTQAASGGRFVLGIGLSHQIVIENMFGISYEKPARHMREYMEVLAPLLRGEPAKFEGDQYRVNAGLQVEGATPVPVLLAALGDHMLKIAGRTSSGTILWMTGPKTIETHIVPKLTAAAAEAGRPAPRVVAGLPIVVTNDPETVLERIGKSLVMYGQLPSYRAMLDKEGAAGPADVALVGDEKALDERLDRLRDVGVTDFDAAIVAVEDGADERTLAYLESRL
ncbi:MAG: LLM class F420-dependent oxidoreductase [Myxococcales bacterium]|nr:LLM class F420-dependent oxidoreductase [Myxococcales bacterium]